jgi:hypothetical protein
VLLDGALAYRELTRDLLIGIALRHKIEDRMLSSCDSLAFAFLSQDHITPPFVQLTPRPRQDIPIYRELRKVYFRPVGERDNDRE